jgi:hypothetical protein
MPVSSAAFAGRGVRVSALAGACWIAFGLESILRPEQDNTRDAVWMLPWVLTAVALWFVHKLQRAPMERLERTSFALLMTTFAVVFLGNFGLVANVPSLTLFAFPWGAFLWVAAMLVWGIATWKAGVFPRPVALGIMLLEPGSMLTGVALSPISPLRERGAYSGAVEKGAVILLVALGLEVVRKRLARGLTQRPGFTP